MRTLLHCALCHTVVMHAARKGGYSATSPDELALVHAAREFGVELKDVKPPEDHVQKRTPNADGTESVSRILEVM